MLPALFRRSPSASATRSGPRCFVVVPAGRGQPCDAARHLLEAARRRAEGCVREAVELLAVEAATGRARPLDPPGPGGVAPGDWRGTELRVLMNVAFVLDDPPPFDTLVARAEVLGWALAGVRSTRDMHAFAFHPARTPSAFVAAALRHLVAGLGDGVETLWRQAAAEPLVPAAAAGAENSPALSGVSGAWARRPPESPRYLNTALAELLETPAERGPIDADPRRMARALAAQRERSRVPWVFNTLLNALEHRLGTIAPASFPPELRLDLGGADHGDAEAHGEGVTPHDVERLDFLCQARTLRLDSRQCALARGLPAMVAALVERHPHLGLDVLADPAGLRQPGIVPALVGRARWVSLSLDGAPRGSGAEPGEADPLEQACREARALTRAKRERRSLIPLMRAVTVVRSDTLAELPRLPALCRELGFDRLTALSCDAANGRSGPGGALAAWHAEYAAVHDETVRQAERHRVSLELPRPSLPMSLPSGARAGAPLDFARVAGPERSLAPLLETLRFECETAEHCACLWRRASIGPTLGAPRAEGHHLRVCLGPLRQADLSAQSPFSFLDAAGFVAIWHHPVLLRLRQAQHEPGLSPVCDACRAGAALQPERLSALVAEFAAELNGTHARLSA